MKLRELAIMKYIAMLFLVLAWLLLASCQHIGADVHPPEIALHKPPATSHEKTRKIVLQKNKLWSSGTVMVPLTGTVTDDTRIQSFFINDQPVQFDTSGHFNHITQLTVGKNELTLVAIDQYDRRKDLRVIVEVEEYDDRPGSLSLEEYLNQAVIHLEVGEKDKAREALSSVLRLDSDNQEAINYLQQIEANPEEELGKLFFYYTVQSGDTMRELAQKYLYDASQFYLLSKYNNIKNPRLLKKGMRIKIPDKFSPQIVLYRPRDLKIDSPISVKTEMIDIVGTITDDHAGIRTVSVNGTPISLEQGGYFRHTISLRPGKNEVTILAENKNGTERVWTYIILREAEPNAAG